MKFQSIETDRFLLKVLTEDQVSETYLSWFNPKNDIEFIEYAKNKITLESLKVYVKEKLESENCLFFAIYEKEKNNHIGNIKFEPLNFSEGYTVLGVLIGDPEWRGKSVFTEIFSALIKELGAEGIAKIYLGVSSKNKSAVAAYKKSGFIIDDENFLKIEPSKGFSMIRSV